MLQSYAHQPPPCQSCIWVYPFQIATLAPDGGHRSWNGLSSNCKSGDLDYSQAGGALYYCGRSFQPFPLTTCLFYECQPKLSVTSTPLRAGSFARDVDSRVKVCTSWSPRDTGRLQIVGMKPCAIFETYSNEKRQGKYNDQFHQYQMPKFLFQRYAQIYFKRAEFLVTMHIMTKMKDKPGHLEPKLVQLSFCQHRWWTKFLLKPAKAQATKLQG